MQWRRREKPDRCKWHDWFAWYPVKLLTHHGTLWAWLEVVEREYTGYSAEPWQYKAKGSNWR